MEEKVNSTAQTKKASNFNAGRFLRDNNSILILLALLIFGFAIVDGFTTSFYNVILYSAEMGLSALGLGLVMITGNIDLSVGFLAASCGVTLVSVFNLVYGSVGSIPAVIIGVIAALIVGCLLGAFNGFIITQIGISPLIATIATNYIYQGIVYNFAQTSYAPSDKTALQAIAKTKIFGIKWLTPMVIIFVVIIILVALWMYYTKYGNRLHVVGDNPEAGEFAGISVNKTVWVTFILCGFFCAMTGILMVCFNGAAIYTQGTALSTFPISCCVIGGIKMTGGKGTAVHILLGVLIMRAISTIMSTMFLPTAWVNLVTGVILVAVLVVDRFTSKKSADE